MPREMILKLPFATTETIQRMPSMATTRTSASNHLATMGSAFSHVLQDGRSRTMTRRGVMSCADAELDSCRSAYLVDSIRMASRSSACVACCLVWPSWVPHVHRFALVLWASRWIGDLRSSSARQRSSCASARTEEPAWHAVTSRVTMPRSAKAFLSMHRWKAWISRLSIDFAMFGNPRCDRRSPSRTRAAALVSTRLEKTSGYCVRSMPLAEHLWVGACLLYLAH